MPRKVTLAGMMVFRGATMWMLGGQNIGPFPKEFQALSSGFIPDLTGLGKPHGLTLILIAVAVGTLFWMGFRARARDAEFGMEPEPMGVFLRLRLSAISWPRSGGFRMC